MSLATAAQRLKLRIDAPAGKIETVVNDPGGDRRGLAVVAHPHPLHGGSLDNKVVHMLSQTLCEHGFVSVRSNFRGVGRSDGVYDAGEGETEDLLAVIHFVHERYPDLPLILLGFSFGAYVQSRVASQLGADKLVLVAPAVGMYAFPPVPADTVVIHGEDDELIPLAQVRQWTERQGLRLQVVAGADHFFNRKLNELKEALVQSCGC